MQGSFKINQKISRGQWLSAALFIIPKLKRARVYFMLLVISAIAGGFGAANGMESALSKQALFQLLIPVVITIAILFVVFVAMVLYNQRNHPAFSRNISYEFTHWGMEWRFSQGEFEMPWKEILAAKETKSYFLFYGINDFHLFHKKSLSSIDQEIFRKILREKTSFKEKKRR